MNGRLSLGCDLVRDLDRTRRNLPLVAGPGLARPEVQVLDDVHREPIVTVVEDDVCGPIPTAQPASPYRAAQPFRPAPSTAASLPEAGSRLSAGPSGRLASARQARKQTGPATGRLGLGLGDGLFADLGRIRKPPRVPRTRSARPEPHALQRPSHYPRRFRVHQERNALLCGRSSSVAQRPNLPANATLGPPPSGRPHHLGVSLARRRRPGKGRFDLTPGLVPATVAGTDMEQTFYFYRNPA